MRTGVFLEYEELKKDKSTNEIKKLIEKIEQINRDKENVKEMNLKAETLKCILADLEEQFNNMKEKLHNAIDEIQWKDD